MTWRDRLWAMGMTIALAVTGSTDSGASIAPREARSLPVEVWRRELPRPGVSPWVVQPTVDGGALIVGTRTMGNPATLETVYLAKTDGSGAVQWEGELAPPGVAVARAALAAADNSGYVVTGLIVGAPGDGLDGSSGDSRIRVYLAKVGPGGGAPLWQRVYGDEDLQYGEVLQEAPDGTLLVAGTSRTAAGEVRPYLLQTDPNGQLLREARIPLVWPERPDAGSTCTALLRTADGDVVIAGRTEAVPFRGSGSQAFVAKVDDVTLAVVWQTRLRSDRPVTIVAPGPARGFVAMGDGFFLAHVDANGQALSDAAPGGRSETATVQSMHLVHGGGYVLAGRGPAGAFGSGAMAVHLSGVDAVGRRQWEALFPLGVAEWFSDLAVTPDEAYLAALGRGHGADARALLVKFAATLSFLRGDANADSLVDVSDAIYMLLRLYGSGQELPCEDAGDVDDDGDLDLTDIIRLLNHQFLDPDNPRYRPAEPYLGGPGEDPTPDRLGCR